MRAPKVWENSAMYKTTRHGLAAVGLVLVASGARAQPPQEPPRITLPPVEVTAQKEPEDPQSLPLSVTVMLREWLTDDDARTISDAGWFSPNTFFSEFSARKLSNARFRGVGSSPANPGITSYIDGVPQLNANSSSIEFLDVEQVEFVRGPQSALFGRNALGGLVNVETIRPSMKAWTGGAAVPLGNHSSWDLNGNISGPVNDKLGVTFAIDHGERDGFTRNTVTNNLLDSRSGTSLKGQVLWL